jgi:hypothetical protein
MMHAIVETNHGSAGSAPYGPYATVRKFALDVANRGPVTKTRLPSGAVTMSSEAADAIRLVHSELPVDGS